MARHADTKPTPKRKAVAVSALVGLSATPLVLYPGQAFSATACTDLTGTNDNGTPVLLGDGVCQIVFLATDELAIPAGVQKVSILVVGGGAGAYNWNDSVGYAGGGGQVAFIEDTQLAGETLDIWVGNGTNAATDQDPDDGARSYVLVQGGAEIVRGFGGFSYLDANSSKAYQPKNGVADGNDAKNDRAFITSVISGVAGAGTDGDASNTSTATLRLVGGKGLSVDEMVAAGALDSTLWATDSSTGPVGSVFASNYFDFSFGAGGSQYVNGQTPVLPPNGSGWGGSIQQGGSGGTKGGNGAVILRFVVPATTYTVTFDANGGTGSMSNQTGSSSAALTSNTLTRSGFTFAGWNTAADGSGTGYADGASYAFNANLTLYAQWTATTPPAPTPYTGPIPVKLDVSCVPSTGGKATLTGERLSGITAATVDGKTVVVSNASASSVDLEFPALAAGTYDIQYVSSNGNITQQGGLRVCATSTSSTPTAPGDSDAGSAAPERLYVYKRFTNYLGDRGGVVAADRKAITDFINANPGLTHVTCVGSTSGVPAIETDPALATARANNACSIVEELIPGVETRIATNVGLGVGQFYRAVTLFGKGVKG